MNDIITFGSATRDAFVKSQYFKAVKNPDFKTGVAGCFALGSKIEIPEIVFETGGGATNAAVTFSRQGFRSACVGRVGDDISGKTLIDGLKKEKINYNFIQIDKKYLTAYSIILVSSEGERTILVYKGAADKIKDLDIQWKNLKAKWFYISSLSGNIHLLKKIVDYAHSNKIKIAYNPGAQELDFGLEVLKPIFNKIDILILNMEEASYLTKIDYKKEEDIFKKMDEVMKGIVIMSKGPEGVVVSDGSFVYKAGIPNSPVIDRTGCGDAFGSGFVSMIMRGKNISEAIQFATANATSVLQYFGAKRGILKKGVWGRWSKVRVEKKGV